MFTSRAEDRLSLREDKADQRLTARGVELGLVGSDRAEMFHVKQSALDAGRKVFKAVNLTPNAAQTYGWKVNQDGQRRSAWEYLAYPSITMTDIAMAFPELASIESEIKAQLAIEAMYAGYIERQNEDVEALRREESLIIPGDLNYALIGGLTNEVRAKLEQIRPSTLGQAGRIEGMTPGALTALLAFVRRRPDRKRAHG